MKKKNKYIFPVKDFTDYGGKSPAHTGKSKHAVDFTVPEGKPIYAALAGKVVYTKSTSKLSGNNRKFKNEGNGIIIMHANNEYSMYWHLRYREVLVRKGQLVKTGQLIGYSGSTGWSHKPHLHFEVYKNNFQTLQIHFKKNRKK